VTDLRRATGALGILLLAGTVALLGQLLFKGSRGPPARQGGAEPEGLALRTVTIYFGSPDAAGLAAERREVLAHADLAGDVAAAVGELAAGPIGKLRPVLPPGTRVEHVFTDGAGNVYLDFSPELRRRFEGGLPGEILALRGLARTLAVNFNRINAFVILIDGKPASTLGSHLDQPAALRGGLGVSPMTEEIRAPPRPIGVFDSGVGGLTVVKSLLESTPEPRSSTSATPPACRTAASPTAPWPA
jgi:hypothetical protein